jgi:hypothetical protein
MLPGCEIAQLLSAKPIQNQDAGDRRKYKWPLPVHRQTNEGTGNATQKKCGLFELFESVLGAAS